MLVNNPSTTNWNQILSIPEPIENIYKMSPNSISPSRANVFNAFNNCPFKDVKVVIIGQDPYTKAGYADGLAFSVSKPNLTIPPSLNNIKNELTNEGFQFSSNLNRWAIQGVLLLNTILTVETNGKPLSHKGYGWEKITKNIITELNVNHVGFIFLLWGRKAQKISKWINKKNHHIIRVSHPSPKSAKRGKSPFLGSNIFNKVNGILGNNSIKW